MEISEYKELINSANKRHVMEKNMIAKVYAFSNSSVKVGDIITDHIGSIKVNEIKYVVGDIPQCVYVGIELRKDLKPKANNKTRGVWQSNLV